MILEVNERGRYERQLFFGADHCAAQKLDGFLVAGNIFAPLRRDIFEGDPDQQVIDVVAAEMRVAVGGEDLENSVVNFRMEMSKVPPPKS